MSLRGAFAITLMLHEGEAISPRLFPSFYRLFRKITRPHRTIWL